jgi:hypothetical protein
MLKIVFICVCTLYLGLIGQARADDIVSHADDLGKAMGDMMSGMMKGMADAMRNTQAAADRKFDCHADETVMVSVPAALGADPRHGDFACVKKSAMRIVDPPGGYDDKNAK